MSWSISTRFTITALLLAVVLGLVGVEMLRFMDSMAAYERKAQALGELDDRFHEVFRRFTVLRYWERSVLGELSPEAGRRFDTSLQELRAALEGLSAAGADAGRMPMGEFNATLEAYEQTYNRLIWLRTDGKLNRTSLATAYQLISSALLLSKTAIDLKPLFNLMRLQEAFLLHRNEATRTGLEMALASLRRQLEQGGRMDPRLDGYIQEYRRLVDHDADIGAQVATVDMDFQKLAQELAERQDAMLKNLRATLRALEQDKARMLPRLLMELGVIGVVVMSLMGFIYLQLSRHIVRPVRHLAQVVERVRKGDRAARSAVAGDDEIGMLGGTLNGLVAEVDASKTALEEQLARLMASERELTRHKEDLQGLVTERTAELSESVASLSREVQARAQAERELIVARDEANASNQAKSQFLAHMSHEIRTPMNSILGLASLLEGDPGTPDLPAHLKVISMSAGNLLSLIDDLLDFSRIEAGRLELHPESASIARVVDDAVSTMRPMAQGKGIELRCARDGLPSANEVDPIRLRQVLLNLLGNAVKFTQRGHVAVEVEALGGEGSRDVLRFTVSDTGIGIPQDKQRAVFDAFQQADGSITRKFGGSGLGLAISNRLVRAMGAEGIALRSAPGAGSSFSFTLALPRALAAVAPAQSGEDEAVRQKRDYSGLSVLVAEDNAFNQHLMRALLAKAGITAVTFAANGQLAVQEALANQDRFDVVFMDMQMPEMDGLQATRLLRGKGFTAAIVALTANALDADRKHCLQAGMNAFLSKPVAYEELLRVLTEALDHTLPPAPAPDQIAPSD